jgi:phosphatidylethanolamine/phosphatidyl-N-methylethanolamine N-methyltransferase
MSAVLQFFEGFIANPSAVASPVPSGAELAAAVAAQIPKGARRVLELGPGTGAVTQAILARGIPPEGLVAIESDAGFAGFLRETFPACRILEGDAFRFREMTLDAGIAPAFDAIVSGIPVLNRSDKRRTTLLRDGLRSLGPSAPFIQMSYAFTSPFPASKGVATAHAARIWRNIPPLHVWVYRKATE